MLSQIPIAKYQEPLFWANGHRQNQAALPLLAEALQATWRFQRLLHRLGTSNHWECLWRLNGGQQKHWLQAFSGFPRSLTALFSTFLTKRLHDGSTAPLPART